MKDCIFCKIVKGEIPAKKVAETVNILAFYDIDPSADIHILVVPKRHIDSFMDVKKEDMNILSQMLLLTQKLIDDNKMRAKYKLIVNGGEYQFVQHLHWHLLGGNIKKLL